MESQATLSLLTRTLNNRSGWTSYQEAPFTLGPLSRQRFLGPCSPTHDTSPGFCFCTSPPRVASNPGCVPVLRFISAPADGIHRRGHLGEWHHRRGARRSVQRHRELFACGMNLLLDICFVEALCCFSVHIAPSLFYRHPISADSGFHTPGRKQR